MNENKGVVPENLPKQQLPQGASMSESNGAVPPFIIGAILLVAIVVAAIYYFDIPLFDKYVKRAPHGTIHLTLQPLAEGEPLTLYTFDVAKRELSKKNIPGVNITENVNEEGLSVFASFDDNNERMQLFFNREGSDEYSQVTSSDYQYKREPVWAADQNNILYVATDAASAPLPEDWNIFLVNRTGNNRFVAEGNNPVFGPTGKNILYLKNDGMYLREIETGKEVLVWAAQDGTKISSYENISISPDKTLLAWTDHDLPGIFFFKISSWAPFTMELITSLPLSVLDGEFSPDSNYYAGYVYDVAENGALSNPELYIYDLDSLYKDQFVGEKYLDLNNFDQNFVWISGWN